MKHKEKISSEVAPAIDEDQVKNFLEAHPIFIEENHDLLLSLVISHEAGTAASLLEKQNRVLRLKVAEQSESKEELLDAAEKNWNFIARINGLVQGLVGMDNLKDFYEMLSAKMSSDFGADEIMMEFFDKRKRRINFGRGSDLIEMTRSYFNSESPFSGPVDKSLNELYGTSDRPIKSHVIIPMETVEWKAVLILGSIDLKRYENGTGLEFLVHLRDILILAICPLIKMKN